MMKRHLYLIHELVLQHHLLINDLDGDALPRLAVDGQFDLGEGAFADGPAKLVLANSSANAAHLFYLLPNSITNKNLDGG